MVRGRDITATMNSLLHAKPDSAPWNLVPLGDTAVGHAVSKILNLPDLCDDVCANVIPWLVVVQAMMAAYFRMSRPPNHELDRTMGRSSCPGGSQKNRNSC